MNSRGKAPIKTPVEAARKPTVREAAKHHKFTSAGGTSSTRRSSSSSNIDRGRSKSISNSKIRHSSEVVAIAETKSLILAPSAKIKAETQSRRNGIAPRSEVPIPNQISFRVPKQAVKAEKLKIAKPPSKGNILLLGMVFAKRALNPARGQEFRDRVRCEALVEMGYNVLTLDDKHVADETTENLHCNANFSDRRRMIQGMVEQWGDIKFDHIILDYFFSPVGWARTRWTERFYSETLPELARQGKFEPSGKIWLPHLQNVEESVLDNRQIIEDHFTIEMIENPLANPLFEATAKVREALLECPDKLSNDNQMKHLDEYSSKPFMCLTFYSKFPTIKNPSPCVTPTKRKSLCDTASVTSKTSAVAQKRTTKSSPKSPITSTNTVQAVPVTTIYKSSKRARASL